MASAEPAKDISVETDVLIVGGGITGTAAAYYLARDGVDVAVVERDDLNMQGSGRTAGNIHGQASPVSFREMDDEAQKNYSAVLKVFGVGMRIWKDLDRDLKTQVNRDVEVIHGGGIMVAESDSQMKLLERKVAYERAYGLENRLIDATELRKIAPYVTDKALGADYCHGEGHANALLTTTALAVAAEAKGARIFRNAEVTAIERTNRGFETITKRGRVRSRRVINAAGGWCDSVAGAAGLQMPMKRVPIQMIVTEVAPRFVDHLVYHAQERLTMKQVANGNIVIGGAWPAKFGALGELIPSNIRTSVQGSSWIASQIVPGLRNMRLLRAWTGTSNVTADGMPILDEVGKLPGYYVATFPGYGFTGGPLFGMLLADMLQGRKSSFDYESFRLGRFDSGAKALPDF